VAVIAGIDEAGYGPRLGPLVTSCAALRVADGAEGLDLWERLAECVARPGRDGAGGRLTVGDSKAVYTSGGTLAALERAPLAFLALEGGGSAPEAAEALAARLLSGRCRASLAEHPWYADRNERLPLDGDAGELSGAAGHLARGCRRCRTRPAYLGSRALAEGEFNRRVARCGNKATVLLELVAELLAALRAAAGRERLEVCLDRLGGRTDYGPLLALAFPGGFAWEEFSSPEEQRYRVEGLAGPTFVTVRVKADRDCFAAALASMFSKYLREIYMRRFNAWWREVDAGLPVTTGYHVDANKFLEALAPHRARLALADADLIRSR
jgi:hypothetical protein